MKELELPWTKLNRIVTSGSGPSMTGRNTDEEWLKRFPNFTWNSTASFTNSYSMQQLL
jgi:hypothetical protein